MTLDTPTPNKTGTKRPTFGAFFLSETARFIKSRKAGGVYSYPRCSR